MPPKKRASGPTATSRSQGTISFNKNQSTNRITKPSAQSLDEKKSSKKPNVVDVEIKDDALPPTSSEIAIADQAQQAESTDPLTTSLTTENILGGRAQEDVTGAIGGVSNSGWVNDEETRARKIGEKAIASYWAAKERARKAPRVHQQDLSTGEKVLREWDMSGQYGPCVGIARLKRWKRANMLGLNPPIEVLAVLLNDMDNKSDASMQRAHVDELLSSRYVET